MGNEKLDAISRTKDPKFIYRSPIGLIFDKFAGQKDVSFVFGEPIELVNKRVLPVAKVDYYFGGGGGYSDEHGKESVAQGEGGGGYFSVKPLGVYEITSEKVKFKPTIDLKFVLILVAVLTFGLALLMRKSHKVR